MFLRTHSGVRGSVKSHFDFMSLRFLSSLLPSQTLVWAGKSKPGSALKLKPEYRVLVYKLTLCQIFEKFSVFFGNRLFIVVFTRSRHWSLSRSRCIVVQNWPLCFSKIHFNVILFSLSMSSIVFFPSGFPIILYAFLIFPMFLKCIASNDINLHQCFSTSSCW